MALCDIRGMDALTALAELVEPMVSIGADPRAAALFQRQAPEAGEDARAAAARQLQAGLPGLIRDHREDLAAILAALQGTSREDYARDLTLPGLLQDLMDLMGDEDLLRLFT